VLYDDPLFKDESIPEFPIHINNALAELEEKMFGIYRPEVQEERISDRDWIPIKTGTGFKFLKDGPKHIFHAEDHEPLYPPQENILEECLRKESERIANSEILNQKIVYDCFDTDPNKIGEYDMNNIPDALGDY
jgi:hypothetical protein